MGKMKDVHMEEQMITIKMMEEEYLSHPAEIRERFPVHRREPAEIDYSDDPVWLDLKEKSSKAYKALKNYEYDKRHKQ